MKKTNDTHVHENEIFMCETKVGHEIPDFSFDIFHRDAVKRVSLSKYRGKWLILFFYPADFTFVCPTELAEMADHYKAFAKSGAEVISVSTDTVYTHKAWHDSSESIKKIDFPMAADPTGDLCRIFGTYIEAEGISLRGSFIIDPQGILRSIEINDNSIGRSSKELVRRLQAAQYVAKHGDKVCPASWEPGMETLKPGMDLVGKI